MSATKTPPIRIADDENLDPRNGHAEVEPVPVRDLEHPVGTRRAEGLGVQAAPRVSSVMGPPNRAPGVAIMGGPDHSPRLDVMGGPDRGLRLDVMGGSDGASRLDVMGQSDPASVDCLFTG